MEQKAKKEIQQLNEEVISLSDYHFVTIEDFEKAMKDEKFRKAYNKYFEKQDNNKISK